jgi:hypothetical protein
MEKTKIENGSGNLCALQISRNIGDRSRIRAVAQDCAKNYKNEQRAIGGGASARLVQTRRGKLL